MRMRTGWALALGWVLLISGAVAAEEPQPVELPDLGESRLVLPWDEFKGLLEKLLQHKEELQPPEDMPAACLSQAAFSGELAGRTARLQGTLTVHVLREVPGGWVAVPIFPSGVPLLSVNLEGKPAALTLVDEGQAVLVPAKPGAVYTLSVVLQPEVDDEGGPAAVHFPVPLAAVASLQFTVPRRELQFELNGQPVESRALAAGTQAVAALVGGEDVELTWSERIEAPTTGERSLEAVAATLVTVGEDAVRLTTALDWRVRGGAVRELAFLVPAEVMVTSVTGPGVQPYTTEAAGTLKKIRVPLAFEAKEEARLVIGYERGRTAESGNEAVPVLAAADTVRQTTQLGVAAPSHMEVTIDEANTKLLRPIDVQELPPAVRDVSGQPLLFAFSGTRRDWSLSLRVLAHPAGEVLAASIGNGWLDSLVTRGGDCLTRAVYQVTNSNLQFLRVRLPAGARLWSALVAGRPVKPAQDPGDDAVLVPLPKSPGLMAGGPLPFTVELTYHQPAEEFARCLGRQRLEVPLLNVHANRLLWRLHLPEGYVYKHFSGEFEVPSPTRAGRLLVASTPLDTSVSTTEQDKSGLELSGKKDMAMEDRRELTKAPVTLPAQHHAATPQRQSAVLDELRAQAAEQQSSARGLLSIAIAIDFAGIEVPAERQVARAGEGGSLALWYFSAGWMNFVHRLAQLLVLLAALVICLAAYNLGRSGRARMTAWLWALLVGSVIGLGLLHLLFGMWLPSLWKGFLVAGGLVLVGKLVLRRRRTVEAGGRA